MMKVMAAILDFSTITILDNFDLQVILILPTRFRANFQDDRRGGHLGFPIETILAIFDLEVTQIFPTKFRVNWHFGSGEEAQSSFFQMAAMAAIINYQSERFLLFLIYKSPQYFSPSFESTGLSVQEKKLKIDFFF